MGNLYRRRENGLHTAALQLYLMLGKDRSISAARELAIAQGWRKVPSPTTWNHWCGAFSWVERAREYDREVLELERQEMIEEDVRQRRRLRDARLKVADRLRTKADAAIDVMEIDDLAGKPGDVVRMIKLADDTERLDMGEATSRADVSDSVKAEFQAFQQAVLEAIEEVDPDVRDRILDSLRRSQPVRAAYEVAGSIPANL